MIPYRHRAALLALALLYLSPLAARESAGPGAPDNAKTTAESAAPAGPMARGIAAFKAGDHAAALHHFKAARRGGEASATLHYNLAVSHYRLGDRGAAASHFRRIAEDPQWGPLARYNLALLATLDGDAEAARAWYLSLAGAPNPRLRQLAADKLAALAVDEVAPAERAPGHQLYAAVSVGHDSNAASLSDELTASRSDAEDSFVEATLHGATYLSGGKGDGLSVWGLGYHQAYRTFDAFDSNLIGAGLTVEQPAGVLDTEVGALLARATIGGDLLANQGQLRLAAHHRRGADRWSLSYQPGYFDAGDDYGQIEGWQHRLELGWRRTLDAITLAGRYRLDVEDRADLRLGENFQSYSPTRHGLIANLAWQLGANWHLDGQIAYINSRHGSPNRTADSAGAVTAQRRETDNWEYSTGLSYQLSPRWSLTGRYQYKDSDDSIDLYRYDKHQLSAGVEFLY